MSRHGVLLVSPYDLSVPGGVQGQVRSMAIELHRRGRDVVVATPGDRRDSELEKLGIEVHAFGTVRKFRSNGSVAPISLSIRGAHQLRDLAMSLTRHVVHMHEPVTPTFSWSLLRQRDLAQLATFHRSGVDALYRASGPFLRRLLRHLDGAVAVSDAAAQTAFATLGISTQVLFNGIDVAAQETVTPWPTTGPTILFLGRDEPRKGRQVLLDAARLLDPSTTVWLTGEAPSDVEQPGARLEWLGVISEEEKRRRLAGADILCAPSLGGESFGMVLLEGLAARCRVIASDIDGYRQALGDCGRLVPPHDAGVLAAALREELDSVGLFDSERGWQRALDWSMSKLMDSYEELYERAASIHLPSSRR